MGIPKEPKPAKYTASVIGISDDLIHTVLEILMERLGEIDLKSDLMPFNWTRYYEREMGPNLMRRFVSFQELKKRDELINVKLWTNLVESTFSSNGRRMVNIDPGYVTQHHLILATTKEAPHRPYLGMGIFADLTLVFRNGRFEPLSWTYPDYASQDIRTFFERVRKAYLEKLRGAAWSSR